MCVSCWCKLLQVVHVCETVDACIMQVWGWIIATFATTFVGLSMAEIVSALPCSGGPYSWSAVLGGSHAPFWSFITGGHMPLRPSIESVYTA